MDLTIVTLVIIMTVGGQDYERRESMTSRTECWEQAKLRMESLLESKIEGHERVTQIGIGCVADSGNPA